MTAISYTEGGDPDVLRTVERERPDPGPGEVRVRVHVSGVNPTDWKARRRTPAGETVPNQDGDGGLGPDSLRGRVVLVAGGAGAVGNAAIQLARWAGATVLTTVSGPEKAALATAAGAHATVNYTAPDAASAIRAAAPSGVDVVVEVAPGPNAALDRAVLAANGTVAVYATDSSGDL